MKSLSPRQPPTSEEYSLYIFDDQIRAMYAIGKYCKIGIIEIFYFNVSSPWRKNCGEMEKS